jgi:hypothetical protein
MLRSIILVRWVTTGVVGEGQSQALQITCISLSLKVLVVTSTPPLQLSHALQGFLFVVLRSNWVNFLSYAVCIKRWRSFYCPKNDSNGFFTVAFYIFKIKKNEL